MKWVISPETRFHSLLYTPQLFNQHLFTKKGKSFKKFLVIREIVKLDTNISHLNFFLLIIADTKAYSR